MLVRAATEEEATALTEAFKVFLLHPANRKCADCAVAFNANNAFGLAANSFLFFYFVSSIGVQVNAGIVDIDDMNGLAIRLHDAPGAFPFLQFGQRRPQITPEHHRMATFSLVARHDDACRAGVPVES